MKSLIGAVLVLLLLAAFGAAAVIYSGTPEVAATAQTQPLMHWALQTTRENAVRKRAQQVQVPADLGGSDMVDSGFRGFREMCADCHTPPGRDPTPVAQGLNPPPPDLADSAKERSPEELFWVIKHGIQMTGMPAWGPTHSDQEIWELVTFLQELPKLNAQAYDAMDGRLPAGHGAGDHDHGHGAAAGEAPHHEPEAHGAAAAAPAAPATDAKGSGDHAHGPNSRPHAH